jgi:hypothetical protein
MLGAIFQQVLRLILLALFVGQLALNASPALAQEAQPPAASRQEAVETILPQGEKPSPEPATEETTATEGEIKPKAPSPKAKVTSPQPQNPYNRQAIEQFNQELYGE